MRKTRKLFAIACLLIVGLINLPLLNAANNRIEIVQKAKQYLFKNSGGEIVGTLRQEIVEQDLVNGDITIELTLNNAKNTEIMYIFNKSNGETTINNFKELTENVFTNLGTDYTKIGSILVSDTLVTKPMVQTISEVAAGLDEIKEISAGSGATINEAVETALSTFSSSSDNKIIIVVDETNTASNLASQITADTSDVTLILYTTTTSTVEGAISVSNVTETTTAINNTLIPAKNGTSITMPLASYIVENFDISLVDNPSNATLDETTKTINWNLGDIKSNQVEKIRYKLSLKSVIDDSLIGLELVINEAPTIIFNGNTVQNTDANQCSPIIKILNEAIENPKTGVASYIIFGSTLLAIGSVTYLISRKQKVQSL
mgnify:CR=1 FL=1